MKTVSMNRIFFHQPIYPGDLVECVAKVVYTSKHTVHVSTTVTVIRGLLGEGHHGEGTTMHSHSGSFVVANFDRASRLQPITTGIDLASDDKAGQSTAGDGTGLQLYAEAQCRREFLMKNWSALLLQASPKGV